MPTADPLLRYKTKRNFGLTPEPAEGGASGSLALCFVVQKHWAGRLHCDFRLELNGTLKSWAIPKGPSFDPKDKRMAVHVEDHPLPYAVSMPRVIWKGAISFGLVHVPVALYPASQDSGIDFDWLDKRSMDPVGYQRVNKQTGKSIESDHVVKGIKQDDGDYVVLSEEQIKAAYPKTTQTIEIESFVKASEIPFILLERPYYLEPIGKGEKVYALLRESMRDAGVIGIARVVMHTKEHLAALIPSGSALILNTIRRASEIRPIDELKLPAEGKSAASLKPSELKMAAQFIGDMTSPWKSGDHRDRFSNAVQELVNKKLSAGETEQVTPLEDAASEGAASNVVDLTELLAKSLAKRGPAAPGRAKTQGVAEVQPSQASKKVPTTRPAKKRA